jgi:hypothetical protein
MASLKVHKKRSERERERERPGVCRGHGGEEDTGVIGINS